MVVEHVFKGTPDTYGTFAYLTNNELVVGESVISDNTFLYRGSLEDFISSKEHFDLLYRNRELANDIWNYHTNNKASLAEAE